MAWTAPRTWVTAEVVTGAVMNTHVRDNLRYLKGIDGRTDFESAVAFITDETSTLTGSNNNVVLAANTVIFRWNGASTATFTGLDSGVDGRIVAIVNVASTNLVLNDEDALSTAANRFALTGNLTLRPDQGVLLVYDSTSSRWRVAAGGGAIDASDIVSGTIATARLGSGTASSSTFLRGDQAWAAAGARATQAAIEAETNEDTYPSPDRVKFSPGVAKFWVRFNGTGTPAADASYNLTSITDNGVGRYTLVIGTDFSSASYGIAHGMESARLHADAHTAAPVAGSFESNTTNLSGTDTDVSRIYAAAFGDQV